MRTQQFVFSIILVSALTLGCTNKSPERSVENMPEKDSVILAPASDFADPWLSDKILGQIQKITDWTISGGSINVDTVIHRNELTEILYTINDGVSSTNYVMTFLKERYADHEVLDSSPDMDLSYASYSSRQLKDEGSHEFLVVSYLESVADSNLLDPENPRRLRAGYTFDDTETITDSVMVKLTIKPDGIIERDTLTRFPGHM